MEGVADGVILAAPRGAGGLRLRPAVLPSRRSAATFAEIPDAAKHAVSHRGLAVTRALEVLRAWGVIPAGAPG